VLQVAVPARYRRQLADLGREVDLHFYEGVRDAPEAVAEAEVLWLALWRLDHADAAVIAGSRLRWISTNGAGVDFFPLDQMRRRGIVLTNGSGINSIPIAECAVMGMLAAAKSLPKLVRAHVEHRWARHEAGDGELLGTSALVLGYGSIGQAIADRLRPFGVTVTGVRRTPDGEAGVIGPADWRPRLGEFDWVIVSTPLTAATRHLVGAEELAAMRPTARLVNVARGGIVDERALAAALREGRLGGAYLDVTEREPLPPESELWETPNLILTPHSSGMSSGSDDRAVARFLANLARYRAGEPLQDVVDLDVGY